VAAKSQKGVKTKAGQLLSRFLRQISEEVTELDQKDGEDVLVSKAEKLARIMFKEALGYKEIELGKNGGRKEIIHRPDKYMLALLFERIEGRAPLAQDDGNKRDVPDRVDDQAKSRISAAGEISESDAD
jgi:hypothetical protein